MSNSFLSPTKLRLFSLLMNKRGGGQSKLLTIPRRGEAGPCRLSFAQERIWLFEQLEPGTCAYIVPLAVRLSGKVNIHALQLSLQKIVQRHEVLRSTFTLLGDMPVQISQESIDLRLRIIDLGNCSTVEREYWLGWFIENDKRQIFNLSQGPLIRVVLLQLEATEFILLLTIHHIVSDGWSMKILMRELALFYNAYSEGTPSSLPELPIQYADFAVWQRELLQNGTLARQLAYWEEQLTDLPTLELPTDKMTETPSLYGALESSLLSEKLTQELKSLSKRHNMTLFMVLYAAFQVILFRSTWQEDIVIGVPIANRTRGELEGVIGFFVNTLVLRTNLSGNPRFIELLEHSRDVTLNAYANQDLPFDKLVDKLRPSRVLGRTPLFRVFFALNNNPEHQIVLSNLTLGRMPLHNGIAKFDMEISLVETDRRLRVTIIYKVDLFNAGTIRNFLENFESLLEQIVIYPERRLLDFCLPLDQPDESHYPGLVFQSDDKFTFE